MRKRKGIKTKKMAPVAGFEPATKGLTVLCATAALHRKHQFFSHRKSGIYYSTLESVKSNGFFHKNEFFLMRGMRKIVNPHGWTIQPACGNLKYVLSSDSKRGRK